MKRFTLLFFCCLPFFLAAQFDIPAQRIDSVLDYLHQRHLFNGTVLIGKGDQIQYTRSLGWADAGVRRTLNSSSAYNLASVSKQFYCMLVMILQERGQVGYDDPVQQHLPEFPYPGITIRHLMNQTSGLPEYFEMADRSMHFADTLTNAMLLDLLARQQPPLDFEPGSQWQYSNTNYTTLASVIEVLSGRPVERFFQEAIAEPLGLQHTYVYHLKLGAAPASRVYGIRYEGGKIAENDLVRFDGIAGDGNIYASAEDLLKWSQALNTEKLVSRNTLQEAFRSGQLNDGEATGYGYGWFLNDEGTVAWHTGGWVGFRNLIVRYLDRNQTLIVLTNGSDESAMRLIRQILEGETYTLPYTELITDVNIVDGTGLAAYSADVRVVADRIGEIGDLSPAKGEPVTNGSGYILAPGFIDSHSHHDWGLQEHPDGVAATNQGITTIVVGQDGGSESIDSIKAQLQVRPASVNLATFTGHASLRQLVMGDDLLRKATDDEVAVMRGYLQAELEKGSLGLSTGLEYEEAFYADREEVIALARTAAAAGGRYISHIRSEDMRLDEAIDEIIDIGRAADIPVQISHFKIARRSRWGTARQLLHNLDRARQTGINITADVYPYTMWSSTPRVLFPNKNFDQFAGAELAVRELFDPAASVMVRFPARPDFEGKTVSEIGKLYNESPEAALLRIIRDGEAHGNSGSIVATSMSEADLATILSWPYTSVCSDGAISGHPRGYGAFTRVLGRYVRELGVLSLPEAIRKMTSLPAEHLGIRNRGLVAPGYFADLVLFDAGTVSDQATIEAPDRRSTGIIRVWVNGRLVYEEGKPVGQYPGVFVRR